MLFDVAAERKLELTEPENCGGGDRVFSFACNSFRFQPKCYKMANKKINLKKMLSSVLCQAFLPCAPLYNLFGR